MQGCSLQLVLTHSILIFTYITQVLSLLLSNLMKQKHNMVSGGGLCFECEQEKQERQAENQKKKQKEEEEKKEHIFLNQLSL